MTTLTEGRHAAEFVLSEAQGMRSRGNVTIADGEVILPGTVLGKVGEAEGAVTVGAPAFTGTGDGTLTKATPAYGTGVQVGTYQVVLTEIASDSGKFDVIRPDGTVDGQAVVGVAYDGQVKFTIADGSTDFGIAAKFTLAVSIAAASDEGQFKAYDQDASDGAEVAAGIALYAASPDGETATIAAIVRDAEVNSNLLVWPGDIDAGEQLAAIAQLTAIGILVR